MRTFEYRLRPIQAQEQALMSVLMASCKMYNTCLEELITHYKETGKYLHLYEQDKRHGKKAHPDLPAVVVDTTLKRLHRSFTNFFRGLKEGRHIGFPRFKNATAWNTIQFRDAANCLDNGRFKAPGQCGGRIHVIVHRPLEGTFNCRCCSLHLANMFAVWGVRAQVPQCPDACVPFLWLHGRPRRKCRKKHPATRLAGFGSDGAFVEPKRGA
jgi:Helix-turn-helix domain